MAGNQFTVVYTVIPNEKLTTQPPFTMIYYDGLLSGYLKIASYRLLL